jgi:cyclic nucleotide gated channel
MNRTHSPSCNPSFLDCTSLSNRERQVWFRRTRVLTNCDALNVKNHFQFGMFADAFTDHVSSSKFIQKYFYCLWWGLKNLRFLLLFKFLPILLIFDVIKLFEESLHNLF